LLAQPNVLHNLREVGDVELETELLIPETVIIKQSRVIMFSFKNCCDSAKPVA
jgi:hypothetical protein